MENNNKLIAEFMGVQLFFGEPYNKDIEQWEVFFDTLYETKDLAYHTDWNWLMPVIRKIEELGNDVLITTNYIQIAFDEGEQFIVIDDLNIKINSVYKAVIEFIKWYNENK
jgi:hypothetical protein